jgi:Rrf2 family protein
MKLARRVQYGLRILCQLARSYSSGPLQLGEISAREGISEKYLGQIMLSLRAGKIVEALRGSQGGYYLARDPASISVLELLIAIDGDALELDEAEDALAAKGETGAMAREAWTRLRAAMEGSLSSLSLDDLRKIVIFKEGAGDFTI